MKQHNTFELDFIMNFVWFRNKDAISQSKVRIRVLYDSEVIKSFILYPIFHRKSELRNAVQKKNKHLRVITEPPDAVRIEKSMRWMYSSIIAIVENLHTLNLIFFPLFTSKLNKLWKELALFWSGLLALTKVE